MKFRVGVDGGESTRCVAVWTGPIWTINFIDYPNREGSRIRVLRLDAKRYGTEIFYDNLGDQDD